MLLVNVSTFEILILGFGREVGLVKIKILVWGGGEMV